LIEVAKKFPNVFGRHLISINILPKKKEKDPRPTPLKQDGNYA